MTRRSLHGGGRPSLTPARSQVERGKRRLIRFVQVGRGKRFGWNYHFTYVMKLSSWRDYVTAFLSALVFSLLCTPDHVSSGAKPLGLESTPNLKIPINDVICPLT